MMANFGASFWQSEALWPAGWYFSHCWCSQIIGFIRFFSGYTFLKCYTEGKIVELRANLEKLAKLLWRNTKPHNEQPTHNELRSEWTKHFNVICRGGDLPADLERSYLLGYAAWLFWAKKLHYRQLVLFYVAVWSENSTYLFGAYICHLATANYVVQSPFDSRVKR